MPYTRPSSFPARSPEDEESYLVTPQPEDDSIKPDPMFLTDKIFSLNEFNLNFFTKAKEKTLVLFYNSSRCQNPTLEMQYTDLADSNRNVRYGFGAVDCHFDCSTCTRENAIETPMMKVYSNGFEVSSIKNPAEFDTNQMYMLMKMTPILTKPRVVIGKSIDVSRVATPPKKSTRFFNKLLRR